MNRRDFKEAIFYDDDVPLFLSTLDETGPKTGSQLLSPNGVRAEIRRIFPAASPHPLANIWFIVPASDKTESAPEFYRYRSRLCLSWFRPLPSFPGCHSAAPGTNPPARGMAP